MKKLTLLLAFVVVLALVRIVSADDLTPEEQALLDKNAVMQMYKPAEHSRHFIACIAPATGDKTDKVPVLCYVFGMEDAKPPQEEGRSMAQCHYSRAEAHEFLFAEGWDKYHDRFFTRCYVQEGETAYNNALKRH